MRIALIATHHSDYAANLAMALAARHQVMLVLNRRNARQQLQARSIPALRQKLMLRFVPHHLAPLQPWIAWRCARLIRAFSPDIVHVQEHPSRSITWLAEQLGGRYPFMTTVHDPRPHVGNDRAAADIYADYYRRLRTASDRLITHGTALRDTLIELGFAPDRVCSIPHGVLHFGRHGFDAAPTARSGDQLIFFGRIEAYKGLDTLLAANRLWLERKLPMRLLIVGRGAEDAVIDAPNTTRINRYVAQPELEAMVRESTAALLPYHEATQSGVLASALGAGLPVIASDVGGLAEALGDAGLLVPPGDPVALADVGERLLTDVTLRTRLEKAARDRAKGALGWPAIAAQTLQCYAGSVARHDNARTKDR